MSHSDEIQSVLHKWREPIGSFFMYNALRYALVGFALSEIIEAFKRIFPTCDYIKIGSESLIGLSLLVGFWLYYRSRKKEEHELRVQLEEIQKLAKQKRLTDAEFYKLYKELLDQLVGIDTRRSDR